MKENKLSRRTFVEKYLYAGAVLVGGAVVFGCNPSPKEKLTHPVSPLPEPVKPTIDTVAIRKDSLPEPVKDKAKQVQQEKQPIQKEQTAAKQSTAEKDQTVAKEKRPKKAVVVEEDCDDLTGVAPEEIEKRKKLAYVNSSPIPDSNCANCALHIPAKAGKNCGGCILFKGPVRAEGYCAYWAPINS